VNKNSNKGFTLIDVICAVTIMMLVVLPIFSGFVMAAKTNAKINERLDIELILQNELEIIRATGKLSGVECSGIPTTAILCKGNINGKDEDNIEHPKGEYTKTVSEIDIVYFVEQVKSDLNDDSSIAYYRITITYDNQTPDDTSDDILVKGVYSPW
jgi:type II secretory pathway pseudopilin PulG